MQSFRKLIRAEKDGSAITRKKSVREFDTLLKTCVLALLYLGLGVPAKKEIRMQNAKIYQKILRIFREKMGNCEIFMNVVFAIFRFVFAFFASFIFAKKFAKYKRKFSHFFTKHFVRCKPYLVWGGDGRNLKMQLVQKNVGFFYRATHQRMKL